MYKNCTTEESAHRQQQLEERLLKNMLLKPYDHISVSDLCEQCNISRKSFYRYFGNKDGCLSALIDRALLESTEYHYQPEGDLTPTEVHHHLAYWKEKRILLDALAQNGLFAIFVERSIAHAIQEEKDLLRRMGVTDPQRDRDVLVFVFSGYAALLLHWRDSGFAKSVPEMAQTVLRLITRPLMNAEAK